MGVFNREFVQQPYEPSDGFCAVRTVWLMAYMARDILPWFSSEMFVIFTSVKFSLKNKLPNHHTHLLQWISSGYWNFQRELGLSNHKCCNDSVMHRIQPEYIQSKLNEWTDSKVMPSESHMVHTAKKPSDGSSGCCANRLMIIFTQSRDNSVLWMISKVWKHHWMIHVNFLDHGNLLRLCRPSEIRAGHPPKKTKALQSSKGLGEMKLKHRKDLHFV
jgi:hypothetical protein